MAPTRAGSKTPCEILRPPDGGRMPIVQSFRRLLLSPLRSARAAMPLIHRYPMEFNDLLCRFRL
jgi:hypothetical protein